MIILSNDFNQVLVERYQDSEQIQLFLKEVANWLVQDVFSAMEDFYSSDNAKSIDVSDEAKQRFVDYVNNRRIQLQSNYRMLWSVLKIMLNDRLDSLTEFVGVCCGVGSDEYVLVKFFFHELRYEFLEYDLFYYNFIDRNPEVFEIFQRMREQKYGELRDADVYEEDLIDTDEHELDKIIDDMSDFLK